MSTVMDSVGGKGRSLSTNFWVAMLVGSLVVFAGNTLYATTKASRLGGASASASRLQLNSQRLANQGREAIGGDAEAFDAFKATKNEVDADIKTLNDRFGDNAGVAGPIRTVTATWDPLSKRAEEVSASEQAVLGLAFKPDIDDLRESPAMQIAQALSRQGRTLWIAEPHIEQMPPSLAHQALVSPAEAIERADVVVVLVAHQAFGALRERLRRHAAVVDAVGLLRKG